MTDIPTTLADATSPRWLSSVLGTEVLSVTVGDIDQRVSTNIPVQVELDGGATRDVWIKGYFAEGERMAKVAGVPEAGFYRDLAGRVGLRTLRPLVAAVDDDTGDNVVVTEDEMSRGARFLHALDPYSVDQTADTLEQLAALHARTWMADDVLSIPWLDDRLELYTLTRGRPEIAANFDGPLGRGVPEAVRDVDRLFLGHQHVARLVHDATPWAVIHGDPHIGNVFVDAEGRPGLLDWQLVQRGPWYVDVGYHIASVLTVDDRRAHERALVEHYFAARTAHGVARPADADVWPGLCAGMVHGFYLWGITQRVDPPKIAVQLERLGTAVADHDAYAAVGV